MYLEAAKHSVEPALTVTEQDTYLYQSGWYRRVIGPFFGSDDPAFFVSVDRISSSLYAKKKRREKMADKKMVEAITSMEEEIGVSFGEDILRLYGNIDISKAKEYQDVVEQYYPIETIVYGIKNNRPDFIEKGRKEIYIRTRKDEKLRK